MINDTDDLDPRLATRIRAFSEQSLDTFDPERAAAAAMSPARRPMWLTAATVGSATLVVLVGIAVGSSLLGYGPVGQGPAISSESPSAAASPTASDTPSATASVTAPAFPAPAGQATPGPALPGLTEEAAAAAARAAAPQSAAWPVVVAKAGPAGELLYSEGGYQIAPGLPHDRWVWVIILGDSSQALDGEGSIVVIDFLDGTVYEVVDWIS